MSATWAESAAGPAGGAAEVELCDFCGLPTGGVARPGRAAYCCLGCRLAAAITAERGEAGATQWTLARLGTAVFFAMSASVFTMALWTADVYRGDPAAAHPLASVLDDLFRYLALLTTLPVLWLLGGPLASGAWQQLGRGRGGTDLVLCLGVLTAFVYSVTSVVRGDGPIYFEIASAILVAVTLGRWLEATGKLKASAALENLTRMLPERVRLVADGRETWRDAAAVVHGDRLRILPGERVACDGRVIGSRVEIDEQILTGESRPTLRRRGQRVAGGSLLVAGELWLEADGPAGQGTLARLVDLVRTARLAAGRYQRLADRAAAWFMPAVALLALATFAAHWHRAGFEPGLMAALAVVMIACPCALALATPLAVWAALGRAARGGMLFRGGEALERLAGVRALCFDKTGTLTTGQPRVERIVFDPSTPAPLVRQHALAVARASNHHFSRAICDCLDPADGAAVDLQVGEPCRGFDPDSAAARRVDAHAGRGVVLARAGEPEIHLGSDTWLDAQRFTSSDEIRRAAALARKNGQSYSLVAWQGRVRGVFVFEETLRDGVLALVEWARREGLYLCALTGDHDSRGQALASALGIPVDAELLPQDKLAVVRALGERIGPVAMVGDGLNDAPALAASAVGIALGCGADLSRHAAKLCLVGDDPGRIREAIELSRQTLRVVRQNLAWTFAYNVVGISLAAGGWLNPIAAALLMVVSSASVVSNSLRLAGGEHPTDETMPPEGIAARQPASRPAEASGAEPTIPAGLTSTPLPGAALRPGGSVSVPPPAGICASQPAAPSSGRALLIEGDARTAVPPPREVQV